MRVKQFNAKDWRQYRAIRLEALSRHADVYGNSLELEQSWSDEDWHDMVGDARHAFFGLYDGDELVGCTAVFTDRNDISGKTALLAGSYIRQDYRGRGLSRKLYDARLEWIRASKRFDAAVVGHKEGNEVSRRANQAFGFTHSRTEEKTWGDGSKGTIHIYTMRLK
ncbi:MAG: hypothetical protein DI626_01550 [Micavibrio aeruginosavorus]|uniref:N-acetyltransferase domain-containing protein n=1 Tax=Micavibrio aeruginosavorus TaxID=349221 RepID=A0A2W5BZP8_9BACT|nr:MAG: hypothetical protein DI626_01550 [Micavibrio aeruginosavorus]